MASVNGITVTIDMKDAIKHLNAVARKQVPFAAALALTKTAQLVKDAEVRTMQRVLDNPTPFTLKSLYVKTAKKSDLHASVFFKDYVPKGTAAGKYLQPVIKGGGRPLKRSEKLIGRYKTGAGQHMAPGAGARLNKYGNITKGQIQKALSGIHATTDVAQRSKTDRGFFFGTVHGITGIWQRTAAGGVKPFLIRIRQPHYRPIFDFYGVAQRVTKQVFNREFDKALTTALATAR